MLTAPISVVIPSYNGGRFIKEAIESIYTQSLSVSEIIVVDNNSSDNSGLIAEDLGATVIEEKRQGLPKARNTGMRACTQEWISFLDADDVWEENKIELQWRAIQRCPSVGIVFTDYHIMRENSIVLSNSDKLLRKRWEDLNNKVSIEDWGSYFAPVACDFFLRFSPLPSTAIIHRDVFSTVGGFDESMIYLDDLEFFWRAVKHFPVTVVERRLMRYRQHDHNASRDVAGKRQALFSMIDQMIAYPEKYPAGVGQAYLERVMEPFVKARLEMKKLT